jgi:hypothetical protein
MLTLGLVNGGCNRTRRCRAVCRNLGEVPTKKMRSRLCGKQHEAELCSTRDTDHPSGKHCFISRMNQSPKLSSSPRRRLRMPGTFSSIHQLSWPWVIKWMIHAATVRNTQLRGSSSSMRDPMVENGGHGGPDTRPSAVKSKSWMSRCRTSPARAPACTVEGSAANSCSGPLRAQFTS